MAFFFPLFFLSSFSFSFFSSFSFFFFFSLPPFFSSPLPFFFQLRFRCLAGFVHGLHLFSQTGSDALLFREWRDGN